MQTMYDKRVSVFRKEHFNAAHRLFNPAWDDAKNEKVFGKCALPNYHGHNYEMEVKVTGKPDANTGYVIDLKQLSVNLSKRNTWSLIIRILTLIQKNLRNLNPTAENIAIVIYKFCGRILMKRLDLQVRLYETAKKFCGISCREL